MVRKKINGVEVEIKNTGNKKYKWQFAIILKDNKVIPFLVESKAEGEKIVKNYASKSK